LCKFHSAFPTNAILVQSEYANHGKQYSTKTASFGRYTVKEYYNMSSIPINFLKIWNRQLSLCCESWQGAAKQLIIQGEKTIVANATNQMQKSELQSENQMLLCRLQLRALPSSIFDQTKLTVLHLNILGISKVPQELSR
jgi:hypothetical protein